VARTDRGAIQDLHRRCPEPARLAGISTSEAMAYSAAADQKAADPADLRGAHSSPWLPHPRTLQPRSPLLCGLWGRGVLSVDRNVLYG
jgi:hypothetical protein